MRAFTIVPIFFLLGSALLLILTAINGAGTSSILGKFYWSQTDTSNIPGAQFQTTRWTFYRSCDVKDGHNYNCTKSKPAYPYSPKDNFGSESGLPNTFVSSRDTYYFLTRIGWAFILVALFFTVVALVVVPLNFCFAIGGALAAISTFLAFLFTITAACLITAAHVKGRNAFNNAGHKSRLGAKAFGILWAAVACLLITFITSILSALGTRRSNRRRSGSGVEAGGAGGAYGARDSNVYAKESDGDYAQANYDESANRGVSGVGVTPGVAGPGVHDEPISDASKFRFFRVKRAKPEEI
ncbi:FMP45 [Candida margitis]|uniref:FMP45 n=1 Tax=Candida margitis TaxID=1775924 RepID=UPI0022263A72|nr:FMP45 [Candida margitis]KAI5970763.1 FMP45 [Candida margitis]